MSSVCVHVPMLFTRSKFFSYALQLWKHVQLYFKVVAVKKKKKRKEILQLILLSQLFRIPTVAVLDKYFGIAMFADPCWLTSLKEWLINSSPWWMLHCLNSWSSLIGTKIPKMIRSSIFQEALLKMTNQCLSPYVPACLNWTLYTSSI